MAEDIKKRQGLALILVVGVLGVLAVLGSAFAVLSRLERRAAGQRVLGTQALLLARSGLEDALARLSAGQDPGLPGSDYGGEDWDASGGALSAFEAAQEVCGSGTPNTADCPVLQAMRPSFFKMASTGKPLTMGVEGRQRGYSGRLPGDGASDGDTYALKVEDESAKINVNGGFLDALNRDAASGDVLPDCRDPDVRPNPADPKDTGLGWNFQLARILGVLGNQPELGLPTLGTDILANRPVGGYRSVAELQQRIGTTLDLSPWLTVSSWADARVAHPNAYRSQASSNSLSDVKTGRNPLALESGGRPPVNLNAASRPVLIALIQGLHGTSWHQPTLPATFGPLSPGMSAAIAEAIAASRPFRTWQDFERCCDAMVPGAIHGMTGDYDGGNLCGADLIKANFDPNAALNKELPDQLRWRWIDKSDLLAWSTEGCLSPTGRFRISSLGRILGRDGRILAKSEAAATVECFALARQTTQADFVAGRSLGSAASRYVSLSSDTVLCPSSGTHAGAAWWGGGPPPGAGPAVLTYPAAPMALPAHASGTDGAIALATLDMPPHHPLGGTLTFLHHFDDSWDADLGGDKPLLRPATGINDLSLQTDLAASLWPSAGEPNTVYPDGMHAQWDRCPAFNALGNFPADVLPASPAQPTNHGALSYWVKAVKDAGVIKPVLEFHVERVPAPGQTHLLTTGRSFDGWGLLVENQSLELDPGGERIHFVDHHDGDASTALLPGARWHLVAGCFDTDATNTGLDVYLGSMQAGPTGLPDTGFPDALSGYPAPFVLSRGENLVQAGARMVMGGHPSHVLGVNGKFANQVLDEFAVCDFTDDASTAKTRTQEWALCRYRQGRYYKMDDGTFTSAALRPDPAAPVRLLAARWTAYLPKEGRLEILQPEAPETGVPRFLDPVLARSSVEVFLTDSAFPPNILRQLSPGGAIGLRLLGFGYQVRFKPHPVDPFSGLPDLDMPVLETPVFDDITFAWQPAAGPRVLAWQT